MTNYYPTQVLLRNKPNDVSAFVNEGKGSYRIHGAVNEDQIVAMAQTIIGKRLERKAKITSPALVLKFLSFNLGLFEREIFYTLFLDNSYNVICSEEVFRGTLDQVEIYPREIARLALQYNAAAVLFAHNHPSGVREFSRADIEITKLLQKSLGFFFIQVLDHIIIVGNDFISMKQSGILL